MDEFHTHFAALCGEGELHFTNVSSDAEVLSYVTFRAWQQTILGA